MKLKNSGLEKVKGLVSRTTVIKRLVKWKIKQREKRLGLGICGKTLNSTLKVSHVLGSEMGVRNA
jgi:hypothetical protein